MVYNVNYIVSYVKMGKMSSGICMWMRWQIKKREAIHKREGNALEKMEKK